MKRIFTFLLAILLFTGAFAQAPEKMSYQAVIRNSSNQLVTNQQVGMQISILQGSANGTTVYMETQNPTTNANGLISIEIGTGLASGDFSAINWANGPFFIQTETDPSGGINYTITGTSQLLSVPYALHAKTAETISGTIPETDPVFKAWDKSSGISITESQISNLKNYIQEESDPDFKASPAGSITDSGSGAVITTAERTKLAALNTNAEQNVQGNWNETDNTSDAFIQNKPTIPSKTSELTNDKGFLTSESDPDFHASSAASITDSGSGAVITTAERTKLAALNTNAEQNVQGNWNETDNTSDAFIKNKPSIATKTSELTNDEGFITSETDPDFSASPAASITDAGSGAVITDAERTKLATLNVDAEQNVQANWNETDNTSDSFIKNKPSIPTKTSELTNDEGFITAETDPVFNASSAASITDAGSGAVITDAERTKLAALNVDAEQNVQANWDETDNTSDAFIQNKPSIPTKTSDLTNDAGFLTTETDPVFKASPAASVTDAGSGSIITDEERKRWNNAIPDTIMHPENGIYAGGLIGSFQTHETVYTEGLEQTKQRHVLVFSVPSNASIEQRFSYVDLVYSASGASTSLEEQLRMVLTKEFDYTRKPYDKSYTIYIKLYQGETLYLSTSVTPENPATSITDDRAHTINTSLVSEGTVRISLDWIDPLETFTTYITESYGYMPYAYVDDFSGQETQLTYSVMNYGKAKANFTMIVRDCSQNMSVVSANKFILESKETGVFTTNLYFPNLSYTGSINLWMDLVSPEGTVYDEVQVFFNRVAADEEAASEE